MEEEIKVYWYVMKIVFDCEEKCEKGSKKLGVGMIEVYSFDWKYFKFFMFVKDCVEVDDFMLILFIM